MERPLSTMSEASNYTGGSDNNTNADSPAGRVSDVRHLKNVTQHQKEQFVVTCNMFAALQAF